MQVKKETKIKLLRYYQGQFFKLLNIYEDKDINGYKFAERFRLELTSLPYQITELADTELFNIILNKLDVVVEELIVFNPNNLQIVKNCVFESCNLFNKIERDLL